MERRGEEGGERGVFLGEEEEREQREDGGGKRGGEAEDVRWVEGLVGKFWREKRGGVSLGRMTEHADGVAKWCDLC